MATGILKKIFPKLRFLYIFKDPSHFNKVFADVINELDSMSETTVFMGIHNASGQRFFIGYIYPDKTYGGCFCIQYDGRIYVEFLNAGTITKKSLG